MKNGTLAFYLETNYTENLPENSPRSLPTLEFQSVTLSQIQLSEKIPSDVSDFHKLDKSSIIECKSYRGIEWYRYKGFSQFSGLKFS